jgi:hypothetical protein
MVAVLTVPYGDNIRAVTNVPPTVMERYEAARRVGLPPGLGAVNYVCADP